MKYKNIIADTSMREAISGEEQNKKKK